MVIGCAGAPVPVTVDVGVHRVSFIVPEGWQHYDHGREQRLETSDGDIVLTDLGPVAAEGYRPVVLRARELYRKGQREDAKQLLRTLSRGPRINNAEIRSALDENFKVVWVDRPAQEVEEALSTVLAKLEQLPEPDLDFLATAFLADFGHGPRRDIERQQRRNLDGRAAREIVTWERLTHDHRRWHVFVVNRGNLLVVRTDLGPAATLGSAYDTVVRSLVFVEPGAH
jgi:hypothetical protein